MRYFFKVFALLLIVFNFSPSFAVTLTCPASTFQNHQALVDSIPEGGVVIDRIPFVKFKLGGCYFVHHQNERAFQLFTSLANEGFAPAAYMVAHYYLSDGTNIHLDKNWTQNPDHLELAIQWFERALSLYKNDSSYYKKVSNVETERLLAPMLHILRLLPAAYRIKWGLGFGTAHKGEYSTFSGQTIDSLQKMQEYSNYCMRQSYRPYWDKADYDRILRTCFAYEGFATRSLPREQSLVTLRQTIDPAECSNNKTLQEESRFCQEYQDLVRDFTNDFNTNIKHLDR